MRFSNTIRAQGYLYFHWGSKRSSIERYLSNFWLSSVVYKDVEFKSVEHAFQAAKYLYSNRPELFAAIANEEFKDPKKAKTLGGKGAFKERRATLDIDAWNRASVAVMTDLIRSRYQRDALFAKILRLARRQKVALLHYESPFGKRGAEPFWGGYFKTEDNTFYGNNMLGRIMMSIPLSTRKSTSMRL
jgi:ribA/ribD-fused uncharacterized protein